MLSWLQIRPLGAVVAATLLLVPLSYPAAQSAGAGQYRARDATTQLPTNEKWRLLRQRIKYVFIIFQENRSFDHYFGTFPGANGLFTGGRLVAAPGIVQRIRNTDGSYSDISPFLIPRSITDVNGRVVQLYPEDTHTSDHSHLGILHDLHLDVATHRIAANDGYALNQEHLHYAGDTARDADIVDRAGRPPTRLPTLAEKQAGELVMGHLDCDTIPFLWRYADRFTLFDNFHQTTIGPSAPNAIAMIAGQTGETQWALHPDEADPVGLTLPNAGDSPPYGGSALDPTPDKPPYGAHENPARGQRNLTFATLPLSMLGTAAATITEADPNTGADLRDVQADIAVISARNPEVAWEWFQQGFGPEPFDGTTTADGVPHKPHASYVVHHNAPQYFGYLGDNPRVRTHFHALQAFFDTVAKHRLPPKGGVFYVRGGYYNNDGLTPLDPTPAIRARFAGNDDHPAYSDAQISESLVADVVNAVAASPYWMESAIIIAYDETDGLYDHVPPRVRSFGPDGMPLTAGPRIPAIVISPYAAAHTIVHTYAEHGSVIRFIDRLFGLLPLAALPDEQRGRRLGAAQTATFHQKELGPSDDLNTLSDLAEAFDDDRLRGAAPALPPSYAAIPRAAVVRLPHDGGEGCRVLGITPTDYVNGIPVDPPPPDFNPRPYQSPGIPASGTWTP
jgi:phospholipase C